MSALTQYGYLLIADISGYTSFVAGTELDHSYEILADLLGVVCERLETILIFHKLEGDAVFAYAPDSKLPRGETLVELIESTYVAFRDKQTSMQRATSCTCRACRSIPSLDLKLIAHHGQYVIQEVRSIREIVGSDINLVHRLLKNHVSEATGWRAYMMFTEACLRHLNLNFETAHRQVEEYEHLGKVTTYSVDLQKRYQDLIEDRRIMIDERNADLIFRIDFPTPPPVTWEWIQDPLKRNLWSGGHVKWSAGDRPGGRAGKGASNHCAHGNTMSTEVTVDWRPFEYSTTDSFENGKKTFSETFRFEPLPNGGTRVHDVMQIHVPLPGLARRVMAKIMIVHQMKYDQLLQKAARLAGAEYERNGEHAVGAEGL
jgi:uncharacterized protein YndB with AHSA1/START domain